MPEPSAQEEYQALRPFLSDGAATRGDAILAKPEKLRRLIGTVFSPPLGSGRRRLGDLRAGTGPVPR